SSDLRNCQEDILSFRNPGRKAPSPEAVAPPSASGRAIHGGQDHIRRAGAAIRECHSIDAFVIARATLEAALRCDADLLQLLEAPQPARQPAAALALA